MTAFSFLMLVGFDTGEAVLPATLGTCCQVLFSGVMISVMPKLGVYNAFILGHVFFTLSFAFWGYFTIYLGEEGLGHWSPYVANILQSFGFTTVFPAFQTIVSQRVEEYNQSKCNAAFLCIGTAGAILGTPLYSDYLFDGTAVGMAKAFPANCSFWQSCGTVLLAIATKQLAKTTKSIPELTGEAERKVAKDAAAEGFSTASNPIASEVS